MHPHLSIVTLGVADLPRSRAFYEALGWTAAAASNDRIAFFQLNGLALALHPREDCWPPMPGCRRARRSRSRGVTLAHNLAGPEAVDAAMAEAEAAGGRVVKPAAPTGWGGYSGYVADPDGHLVGDRPQSLRHADRGRTVPGGVGWVGQIRRICWTILRRPVAQTLCVWATYAFLPSTAAITASVTAWVPALPPRSRGQHLAAGGHGFHRPHQPLGGRRLA